MCTPYVYTLCVHLMLHLMRTPYVYTHTYLTSLNPSWWGGATMQVITAKQMVAVQPLLLPPLHNHVV